MKTKFALLLTIVTVCGCRPQAKPGPVSAAPAAATTTLRGPEDQRIRQLDADVAELLRGVVALTDANLALTASNQASAGRISALEAQLSALAQDYRAHTNRAYQAAARASREVPAVGNQSIGGLSESQINEARQNLYRQRLYRQR